MNVVVLLVQVQDVRDCVFFFFNDTATTEIYTLSLHDALPIYQSVADTVDVVGSHGFFISVLIDLSWRASSQLAPRSIQARSARGLVANFGNLPKNQKQEANNMRSASCLENDI